MSADNLEKFTSVKDFEEASRDHLTKKTRDFYGSGAMGEQTLRLNETAFSSYRVRPRTLVDVSKRDITATVLGRTLGMPIGVSPTAMQKLAHSDGEIGNARGTFGSVYILSTMATTSIEDVATGAPETIKWFQLYVCKNRDLTRSFVRRAEKAGFQALVLTVDAPVLGIRYNDKKNNFASPAYLKLENFKGTAFEVVKEAKDDSGLSHHANSLFETALDWTVVEWLKSVSSLPIIIKGILTREDARRAVQMGVSGIIVSNHGGRQLDCCPASIEALPEIVDEVGDECEVYFDGGIRSGSDAFKAIALGARMVFIGRPAIWGLTCGGENGVKRVLKILRDEFDTTMALAGCVNIDEIRRSKNLVVNQNFYAKL